MIMNNNYSKCKTIKLYAELKIVQTCQDWILL